MSNAPLHGVLHHLRRLRDSQALRDADDGQLLKHFARSHEEAPFAVLVRRHGPMVWAVSRRILPRVQDAEDVFQAAFLLLARKARSIRKVQSVGSWLHGVVAGHLVLRHQYLPFGPDGRRIVKNRKAGFVMGKFRLGLRYCHPESILSHRPGVYQPETRWSISP